MRPPKHSEGGFALVEVLVAVAIGVAICGPLLMWMALGFRQHAEVSNQSHDDNATNLVSIYLPVDVASSAAVSRTGPDCGPSAGSSEVVLAIAYAQPAATRTVYAVEPLDGDRPAGALHRRVCDAASGALRDDLVLSDWIERPSSPGGWADLATCAARPGLANDPCGRVELTYVGRSGLTATIAAARRTAPAR